MTVQLTGTRNPFGSLALTRLATGGEPIHRRCVVGSHNDDAPGNGTMTWPDGAWVCYLFTFLLYRVFFLNLVFLWDEVSWGAIFGLPGEEYVLVSWEDEDQEVSIDRFQRLLRRKCTGTAAERPNKTDTTRLIGEGNQTVHST